MSTSRATLIWRAKANDGFAAHQGGTPVGFRRVFQGVGNFLSVMAVHVSNHSPAVSLKARGHIFVKPFVDLAVNGDTVVIVETNQFRQAQRSGQ